MKSVAYLTVPNLDSFRHYKNRNPPWIKLHKDFLSDYEFGRLPDGSKFNLIAIWMLATQMGNKIPADSEWLKKKIGAIKKVDFNILIDAGFLCHHDDSKTLAPRKPASRPAPASRFVRPSIDEIRRYCEQRENTVDAERFMDYYDSNGWRVGKNAMKDWKATIRTWEKNEEQNNAKYHKQNRQVDLSDTSWAER